MLRLLAVLTLAVPAAFGAGLLPNDHPDEGMPPRPSYAYEQVVDVSALPRPNGWVIVPIVVGEATEFELAVEHGNITARDASWGDAVLFGNEETGYSSASGSGSASSLLEASARGSTLRCCHANAPLFPWASWSGGSSSTSGELQAGAYNLVLMVANVETYDVEVTLRTTRNVARVGEATTGTTVHAFDLVADAREATTRVSALGIGVSSPGGAASHAWTSQGTGYLSLWAHAQGGPTAKLAVDLPGVGAQQATLDDGYAYAQVFGAGDFRLKLTDLDEGRLSGPLAQQGGYVTASGIYADLPLVAHAHFWDAGQFE